MVEGNDEQGKPGSPSAEHLLVRQPHRPWSHPPPRSSRPLTARSLLTPYGMAHRLGCPSLSRGVAALPGTNNEAFLPWLTQPGTGPVSRPPACPGHSTDPGRTPPIPPASFLLPQRYAGKVRGPILHMPLTHPPKGLLTAALKS